MTIETIEYLLRLSAVWLALLLFYRWAAPGWAFALRRGYLWFTAAAGALIPLLSFAALADAGQLSGLPTLPTRQRPPQCACHRGCPYARGPRRLLPGTGPG